MARKKITNGPNSVVKGIMTGDNAPVEIPLTNTPDAFMLISKNYIWVHLKDHQRELQYHIDAERLWNQMRAKGGRIPVGDLDLWFYYNQKMGEQVAVFEPAEETFEEIIDLEDEFRFEFEVPLKELENAVCAVRKF